MKVKLDLPMPPSVNAAWRNVPGRGRVKTKAYRSWTASAGWEVVLQKPQKIQGKYKVQISMQQPNKRADADNRVKPTLDLLVKQGVTPDDSNAQEILTRWDESVAPGRMIVLIEAISEA
jgi:crossover junction endodeoxyribonuclease RusA